MKEVIIRNQKEWDELDKNFSEKTKIIFQDAEITNLDKDYKNCVISMHGTSRVGSMYDSSRVDFMHDSSSIGSMYDSSTVGSMHDSSIVGSMSDSSTVGSMHDSSIVGSMSDSSRLGSMHGTSTVGSMSDLSSVDSMYDSSNVNNIYGSSRVGSMSDSSSVGYMYDSSRVNSMSDSSRVNCMRDSSSINKAFDGSVIFTNTPSSVLFADSGVTVKGMGILSSFETMLEHGVLRADGVTKAFKQVKEIGDGIKVYYLEDDTFCAQSEMTFAHAKTLKMAVIDLKFKLSDRNTSDYEDLSLDDKLSFDDAVICYRTITGACSGGVEYFLDKNKVEDKELTIGRIIELTKDAYQGDAFARFFGGMSVTGHE